VLKGIDINKKEVDFGGFMIKKTGTIQSLTKQLNELSKKHTIVHVIIRKKV